MAITSSVLVGRAIGGVGVEQGHGALGEVAPVGVEPFVVGFDEHAGRQPQQGVGVREDPDDVGAPLEFLVDSLDGVGRPDLGPVGLGEVRERGQVVLAARSISATAGSFTARVSATVSSRSRTAPGVG